MKIDAETYQKLPEHLKALFQTVPNLSRHEVLAAFPEAKGQQGDLKGHNKERQSPNGCFGKMAPAKDHAARVESDKSASRFFYCAKASKKDRGEGNNHPTVKPTDLMRYLCRLVTPPGGVVLDPFTGSGSTGKAALLEGFQFIGIEREQEYIEIASARINSVANDNSLMPNQRMA